MLEAHVDDSVVQADIVQRDKPEAAALHHLPFVPEIPGSCIRKL